MHIKTVRFGESHRLKQHRHSSRRFEFEYPRWNSKKQKVLARFLANLKNLSSLLVNKVGLSLN